MYSFVVYLYVNGSGSITSVGEERDIQVGFFKKNPIERSAAATAAAATAADDDDDVSQWVIYYFV